MSKEQAKRWDDMLAANNERMIIEHVKIGFIKKGKEKKDFK